MKNLSFSIVFLLISFVTVAQKKSLPIVSIDKIPQSVEEFITLRDKHANTPQGGAAVWVVAAIMYAQNSNVGRQCLIIASDKSLLSNSNSSKGYQGFDFGSSSDFLIKQLDSKNYVPHSYIQGTSPENGYALPNAPYKIACFTNPYSGNEQEGKLKVFVSCTGADSDRPISLVQNEKGVWKAKEFSSLVVGIKAPKQKSKGAAEGDF